MATFSIVSPNALADHDALDAIPDNPTALADGNLISSNRSFMLNTMCHEPPGQNSEASARGAQQSFVFDAIPNEPPVSEDNLGPDLHCASAREAQQQFIFDAIPNEPPASAEINRGPNLHGGAFAGEAFWRQPSFTFDAIPHEPPTSTESNLHSDLHSGASAVETSWQQPSFMFDAIPYESLTPDGNSM